MYETVLYTLGLGKKVGWVSLTPLTKRSLFTPFAASYKGFKKCFVHITSVSGASFACDSKPLPLYWKYPSQFKGIKQTSLSPTNQVHLGWLEEFPKGMNCKQLVAMIFEPRPVNCLIDFLDQQGTNIHSLLQRVQKEKKSRTVKSQSDNAGQATQETSTSSANLGKRK
ncbi:hypothetical protein CR513_03379, partial [Mucuna pruriens]